VGRRGWVSSRSPQALARLDPTLRADPVEFARMATIRPFRALRPSPQRAAAVSAVPYDVVSTAEARDLAEGNPWSFLHVSRPEIDLPDGTDPYGETVYKKAAENFEKLRHEAPLFLEDAPTLYLYRLRVGEHEQTGIAGTFPVEEYESDIIRKHERTRKEKEDDRTRHIVTLRAQTGPVFLTYRDRKDIDELVSDAKRQEPLYDLTAPDGVTHTVWRLSQDATGDLVKRFALVPLLYIADGHHRAASAARARKVLQAKNPGRGRSEDYNFLLAVVFPAGQVRILPYNRVVKDLNGRSPDEFLAELKGRLSVMPGAPPTPRRKGKAAVYLAGRWHGLELPKPSGRGSAESLDVDLLQRHVLDPLLGIQDVRTDKRIDFVGGIRGTEELERLVDSGRAAAAFSMFPVSLDELMTISDTGETMPPKSTWFEPKLRDGLLVHMI
jgi:uncharacterized protein (DUF1015 family)